VNLKKLNISGIVGELAAVFDNRRRQAPLRKSAVVISAKYFALQNQVQFRKEKQEFPSVHKNEGAQPE
jgi:hypothetical protein